MIRFIFKGLIRDKRRSLLPVIVVSIGVFLTVFMTGWLEGVFSDMIDINANFTTGHVKVVTKSYAENENQMPNDLALIGVDSLTDKLNADYPDMEWVKRIRFGGLLDIPDENGETRAQGQAIGTGIDLLSGNSLEAKRMNIEKSLVEGSMPSRKGEVIISDDFAKRFNVSVGDEVTLFGSTMNGSMMFKTFKVAGTVRFGSVAADRGALIIDITDAQEALDMQDASSEILGYFNDGQYDDEKAQLVKASFNKKYTLPDDEFSPVMLRLRDQMGLDEYLTLADNMSTIMIMIFVFAMSIVLWNTGLLGGLRRYSEFGIRLALGESKSQIYSTTIYEAILVGLVGSVLGTAVGVTGAFLLQKYGISFGNTLDNVTMMMPQTFRARVTPQLFYMGFIPGLFAMVLGNALAGFAIYKRKTAKLFKELEV